MRRGIPCVRGGRHIAENRRLVFLQATVSRSNIVPLTKALQVQERLDTRYRRVVGIRFSKCHDSCVTRDFSPGQVFPEY